MKLVLSRLALAELDDILTYIAQRSSVGAANVEARMRRAFDRGLLRNRRERGDSPANSARRASAAVVTHMSAGSLPLDLQPFLAADRNAQARLLALLIELIAEHSGADRKRADDEIEDVVSIHGANE
jgi:hypothetical protein